MLLNALFQRDSLFSLAFSQTAAWRWALLVAEIVPEEKVLCIHVLQYRDAEIVPEYRVAQPPEV